MALTLTQLGRGDEARGWRHSARRAAGRHSDPLARPSQTRPSSCSPLERRRAIKDEAAIRMASYVYDQPNAPSRGAAAAWNSSGASALCAPWRVRRAGGALAQDETTDGLASNPVTALEVVGGALVATFADGTTQSLDLPSGGVDQTARDAAAAAQSTADARTTTVEAQAEARGVVGDWAEEGNTSLIPANKLRAPTSATRGAPYAVTNTIVDNDAHTGATLYAWARAHVVRMVERIVPMWARVGDTTPIPADKLANAPGGDDAFAWATEGNADPIPAAKLANAGGNAVSAVSIEFEAVGTWSETLGANQGNDELFDVGIPLPAAGDIHKVRVTVPATRRAGVVVIELDDIDTTAVAGVVWASSTTEGTPSTATNSRQFPVGANRRFALGKSTSGTYLFGYRDSDVAVELTVTKLVAAVVVEPASMR